MPSDSKNYFGFEVAVSREIFQNFSLKHTNHLELLRFENAEMFLGLLMLRCTTRESCVTLVYRDTREKDFSTWDRNRITNTDNLSFVFHYEMFIVTQRP